MVRKLLVSLLGAALLGTIGTAQSGPFELTNDSGFPGDLVTLRLIDENTSGFPGVNVLIEFDPRNRNSSARLRVHWRLQ
jgi:hypothetical protein